MSRPWDWSALGLDGDPVPGSAADVRATATEARGTADLIAEQSGTLRTASSRSGDAWEGEAAQEFRLAAGPLADAIAKAEQRYRDLAAALDDYASGLEDLQPQVDGALERAQDAARARRQADLTWADAEPGSPQEQDHRDALDRADADLDAEKALLRRLVGLGGVGDDGEFGELNDALVRAVARAGDDDLRDTWWDEVKQTIHESRGWLNVVHDVLTALGPVLLIVAIAFPVAAFVIGLAAAAVMLTITALLAASGDATAADVAADVAGLGLACVGLGAARAMAAATKVTRQSVIASSAAHGAEGAAKGVPARKAAAATRRAVEKRTAEMNAYADRWSTSRAVKIADGLLTGGVLELQLMRRAGAHIGDLGARNYRAGMITGLTTGVTGDVGLAIDAREIIGNVREFHEGTYWSSKVRVRVGDS